MYKSAFYFALRDTLVVDTLDDATRIAYNGNKCEWRVVTLKGQLIDKAGTMSGGGKRVRKGGMLLSGQKSRLGGGGSGMPIADVSMPKEETEKLEQSIIKSSQELKLTREEKKELKSCQAKLEKQVENKQNELEKKTLMVQSLEQQHVQIQERIKIYEPKCKLSVEDSKKLKILRQNAKEHEKLLEAAKQKAKKLENVCEDVQQQIMNAGGEPLRNQKAKVEEATKTCEQASKELSKAKLACKGLLKKVEKARNAFEEANEELKQLERKKVELEESFKIIEDGALEVIQALEKVKALEKDMSSKVSDMKKVYTQMRTEQNKFDKELIDVENEIDICCDDLAKAEERVSTWTKKELENKKLFHTFLPQGMENKKVSESNENESQDGSDSDSESGIKKKNTKEEAFTSLPDLTTEEAKDIDLSKLRDKIRALKEEVDKMKKNVNMGAIDEYLKRDSEYSLMVKDLEGATLKRDEARNACDSLRKKRLDEFMSGFSVITLKLKEMYQMITMGGDAELELVDSLDPFSEGIVFSVRPPKKSWKNIANLSGGEKTLSSLALVFALHHYNPTPLYVMDEIDAALDYKNVSIVANYIKERTKNAQFIIISLRNNMFELADRLVGIYKTENATKSITINPAKIMQKQNQLSKEHRDGDVLHDCTNTN
uniref:Structural maintenance of chromosomes protein 4 n=1 Tax=Aplanochytrium stocchinoi TaxID=215587 RepID=A0A7S3PE30_9STRA